MKVNPPPAGAGIQPSRANIEVSPDEKQALAGQAQMQVISGSNYDLGTTILREKGSNIGFFIKNAIYNLTISKNIVRTALAGKDGEVIEIISTNNRQIDINAWIINEAGVFPKQELQRLNEWFGKNKELKVRNDYLAWLGINSIVIESLTLPDAAGYENCIPYQIRAVSDKPIDLELNT